MRIALVCHVRHPIAPPFMGGMEAHNWHLAHALIARGHAVTVFAAGDSDPALPLWPILPRHSEAVFPTHDHAGNAALHAHLDAGFARAATALRDGDFDVIHNHALHRFPPRLARAHHRACVTSLHIPPFDALYRAVLASAAPWSRFTVTSQRQMASWWGKAPPPEAAVVHNGIDPARWPFQAQGDGTVVWAGRITPNKAPHLAVEAARLAGIPLTLFGTIEDQDYFDARIRPWLRGAIRMGGHLQGPALAREMGRASALMFTPVWDEPFGLTAIEAMACGLPVAALDNGAAREIVAEAGAIACSAEPAALAHALSRALDIPRHVPRDRVLRHFTLDRMIAGYEAQYRAAIAGLSATLPDPHFPAIELYFDDPAPRVAG